MKKINLKLHRFALKYLKYQQFVTQLLALGVTDHQLDKLAELLDFLIECSQRTACTTEEIFDMANGIIRVMSCRQGGK